MFSSAFIILCIFAAAASTKAQPYGTLPGKNIPIVQPRPIGPSIPQLPLFPPGTIPWKGGVTVGGGLLVPSVCGRLQGQIFDQQQVEKARAEGFDVSQLSEEFFQAMVDVAVVLKDLKVRSEDGRLREKHLAVLELIDQKMSGASAEALDLLITSCGDNKSSFLFLIYSSKQIAHIRNALDYLAYFGNWEL